MMAFSKLFGMINVVWHAVAYLGYGRHGTCLGRHFDGGRKNCLAKIKSFKYSFLNLYLSPHARDGTRLDGTRDNKQVRSCRPHIRTWGLSEANVLYWRKTCDIVGPFQRPTQWFRAPMAIRRLGNRSPFPPNYVSAPWIHKLHSCINTAQWRAEVWWCPGRLLDWMPPYQILVLSSGVWWSLVLDIRCLWRHNVTSYSGLQPTFWRSLLT